MLTAGTRRAFSIAEVVVSVSILAIMGALVIPNVTRYLYRARIQADADVLDSLGYAKMEFTKTITLYPGRISDFGTIIKIGDPSVCNSIAPSNGTTAYASADTEQWKGTRAPGTSGGKAGPYIGWPTPTSGLKLNIGTALNDMRRTTNNATEGFMQILVPEVRYADALMLNSIVDGGGIPGANRTDTSGTVRWVTTPSGPRDTVTLTWNMAVHRNCTGT